MRKSKKSASEPALGYEAKLWQMAHALRNNMDAAGCRPVAFGGGLRSHLSLSRDRDGSSLP